ncbi:MAG: DUF2268 domain-containing putative Zn-dependent protease [Cyclobacteriaceae bacterium]
MYKSILTSLLIAVSLINLQAQQSSNKIHVEDLHHFWAAYESFKETSDYSVFDSMYLDIGSAGLKNFIKGRIVSAKNLSLYVAGYKDYLAELKTSTDQIVQYQPQIEEIFLNLKEIYPAAKIPDVYFVIGAFNSGGTSSNAGLIIGAEMYGKTDSTDMKRFNRWLREVLEPVSEVPHIVAHELIHFQQSYRGYNLLTNCLMEGSADFIAEIISGKNINDHVHAFANPREEELWEEFRKVMFKMKKDGWLYTSAEGRPNDLGYWMGYKICQAYYDQMEDKTQAINDILNIKNAKKFLAQSGYGNQFE